MTAHARTALHCDHNGTDGPCDQTFGPTPYSVDRTRHLAREYGWGGPAVRDLCPRHSGRRGYKPDTYQRSDDR